MCHVIFHQLNLPLAVQHEYVLFSVLQRLLEGLYDFFYSKNGFLMKNEYQNMCHVIFHQLNLPLAVQHEFVLFSVLQRLLEGLYDFVTQKNGFLMKNEFQNMCHVIFINSISLLLCIMSMSFSVSFRGF